MQVDGKRAVTAAVRRAQTVAVKARDVTARGRAFGTQVAPQRTVDANLDRSGALRGLEGLRWGLGERGAAHAAALLRARRWRCVACARDDTGRRSLRHRFETCSVFNAGDRRPCAGAVLRLTAAHLLRGICRRHRLTDAKSWSSPDLHFIVSMVSDVYGLELKRLVSLLTCECVQTAFGKHGVITS